jgi:hypothetical protein
MTMDTIVVTTGNVQELKPRFRGCAIYYYLLEEDGKLGATSFMEAIRRPFVIGPMRTGRKYIVVVTRDVAGGLWERGGGYMSGYVDLVDVLAAIQQSETSFVIEYNAPSYTAAEMR